MTDDGADAAVEYLGRRPYLGISLATTDDLGTTSSPDLVAHNMLIITNLDPDGPAAPAGIRRDDLLTSINGRVVQSVPMYRGTLATLKPGRRIKVGLVRPPDASDVSVDVLPTRRVVDVASDPDPDD